MTLQFQARFNGAVLMDNTRVEAVMPQPGRGVTIETSQGVYHARKVIIAADAWTNKLPITVIQAESVHGNELSRFLCRLIPKRGDELRAVTCQYTITPDRQFIISELEKHKGLILALGNAHAFKLAPAIGRLTAELALDGKTTDDISKFGFPNTTPSKL
ncbi:related to monomeric sarcosine oxidase [Fusarium mangiferae]|uniref:Related to monomeric sarcosine oxidase n=1 Tax=Fusarium mangiferae TaxID=192010 RepID=A0A1L7SRI3_FUSMA|nr:uncharacterized protein FMAN_04485 [Fusarium mangiferae]CVK89158.1 related to monomeric sarcosine oxidase [Fusarium mangiferae]